MLESISVINCIIRLPKSIWFVENEEEINEIQNSDFSNILGDHKFILIEDFFQEENLNLLLFFDPDFIFYKGEQIPEQLLNSFNRFSSPFMIKKWNSIDEIDFKRKFPLKIYESSFKKDFSAIDNQINKDIRLKVISGEFNYIINEIDSQTECISHNLNHLNNPNGIKLLYDKNNRSFKNSNNEFFLVDLYKINGLYVREKVQTELFQKKLESIISLNLDSGVEINSIIQVLWKEHLNYVPNLYPNNIILRRCYSGYCFRHCSEWNFTEKKLISLPNQSISLELRDFLDKKFGQIGEIGHSDKGIYTRESLKKINNQTLFKTILNEDIRTLLKTIVFKNTRASPKDKNEDILDINQPIAGLDDNWKENLTKLENIGWLTQGLSLYCTNCRKKSFFDLFNLNNPLCPRCYETVEIPFSPSWKFKLKESSFLFMSNNSDFNLFSISKLQEYFNHEIIFDYEIDINYEGEVKCELDFIFSYKGKLGIGESKINGKLETKDQNKLKHIISILTPYYFVFSSGKTCNNNCKTNIHELNFDINCISQSELVKLNKIVKYGIDLNPFMKTIVICGKGFNNE